MKVSLYACLFLQNLSLSGGFSHDFAGKINSLLFLLSWPSPAPRRPLYKGLVKPSKNIYTSAVFPLLPVPIPHNLAPLTDLRERKKERLLAVPPECFQASISINRRIGKVTRMKQTHISYVSLMLGALFYVLIAVRVLTGIWIIFFTSNNKAIIIRLA